MLIINADDFGIDKQRNQAIVQCFKQGFCSSTTIMPNMPGFEEAAQLANDNNYLNHVGLHLVLSEGFPLTDHIKKLSRFCSKDGFFCLYRRPSFFSLETSEKLALAEEIRAQIRKCRAYDINISHIDSHKHVHTEWGIANVLIPVAQEEGIPFIRISRNSGNNIKFIKKIYKYILNSKIRKAKLAATKFFGSLDDFLFTQKKGRNNAASSFEIMIHPHFNGEKIYIDYSKDADFFMEKIRQYIPFEKAVSFGGLRYKQINI